MGRGSEGRSIGRPEARRTAVLALADESPFRAFAGDVLLDLGYEIVHARDELDALTLCETLTPEIVATDAAGSISLDTLRRMSAVVGLLVTLSPDFDVSARPVESWIELAAPTEEPAALARQLQLLLLARQLQIAIHVEKQQLTGRLEKKPLLELTRALARSTFTGRVELESGSVFLSAGEVIEARCRPTSGEKAFFRLLRETSGSFTVQPGPVVIDRRIRRSTEELIAEGIGEVLIHHPPADLRVVPNPSRPQSDLPTIQLDLLEAARRNPTLQAILDAIPAPDGRLIEEVVQLQRQGFVLVENPDTTVRIAADGVVDLPQTVLPSGLLEIFPLEVQLQDGTPAEGLDEPLAFYRHLREGRDVPQVAPLPQAAYLRAYRQLLPKQDIVSIHVSEQLSPNRQAAFQAAQQLLQSPTVTGTKRSAPRLKVIDTQTAGLGAGLLVLFATRMASRGKSADFIVQRLSRMQKRLVTLFGVGDAGYFARHGGARLGSTWRRSGATPILTIEGGELAAAASVDTPHDIERRMSDLLRASIEPGSPVFVAVGHAAARQSARLLRDLIDRDFQVVESVDGWIGPLIGRRTGPGAICAALFAPSPEELPWIEPIGDLQTDFQG